MKCSEKQISVLIIEDEPDYNELIKNILEDAGYITYQLYSGENVEELLSNRSFDLIILDLFLPAASGIDVLEKMEQLSDDFIPPVILISGSFGKYWENCGDAVYAYMKKPFNIRDFLKLCRTATERSDNMKLSENEK